MGSVSSYQLLLEYININPSVVGGICKCFYYYFSWMFPRHNNLATQYTFETVVRWWAVHGNGIFLLITLFF